MPREYNKMFDGKRFALMNVVKTRPRAEKIKSILRSQGEQVRIIRVDGGIGIYHRRKSFKN